MIIRRTGRHLLGTAAMLLALGSAGVGCTTASLGPEPDVVTLLLLFPGNDSVLVDIESGVVTSGPISIFSNTDFEALFLLEGGSADFRVVEADFRLDVTPANTGIVTVSRSGGPWTGTLNKVVAGNTTIAFALVRIATGAFEFNRSVDIEVN